MLGEGSKFDVNKGSNAELDLEEKLKDSKLKWIMSLERNNQLERDLMKLRMN